MWRAFLSSAVVLAAGGALAASLGVRPGWGVLAALVVVVLGLMTRMALVRVAHAAFRAGRYRRARWLYRALAWMWLGSHRRGAARVSTAACAACEGDYSRALRELEGIPVARLDDAVRAVWLNNRAYALARSAEHLDQALLAVDDAIELRPDMSAFRHTRGIVLLALGRSRPAVRDLDIAWHKTPQVSELLESERCFDLGRAWVQLGEADYAADYFERARRAAPTSEWARLAEAELAARRAGGPPNGALAAVLDGG